MNELQIKINSKTLISPLDNCDDIPKIPLKFMSIESLKVNDKVGKKY